MKITIFGDSITNGFGMDEGGSSDILARLIRQRRPDIDVRLFGMNGDDSYGALLRVKYVAEVQVDLNFVFFGANDASPYQLIRPAEFSANLEKIARQLGFNKTVLITPPYCNEAEPMHYSRLSEVQLFRQTTLDLAAKLNVPVIDIYQIMANQPEPNQLLRPDGLHFTEKAYQLLTEAVLKVCSSF